MKSFKFFIVFAILITGFSSCEEDMVGGFFADEIEAFDGAFTAHFGEKVNRDFLGEVVDERGDPLDMVLVKIGDKQATTDENGVFIIRDVEVYEKYAHASAQKTGYFQGFTNTIPSEGVNRLKIIMVPKQVTRRVQSGQPESINLLTGGSIDITGAFQDVSGVAYTGEVDVYLKYFTPNENIDVLGMPYGAGSKNHERYIEPFGVMEIALEAVDKSTLVLPEGEEATLHFPLIDDLTPVAPSRIPLWFFNKSGGYWTEAGEAFKDGNSYKAKIDKPGYWCVGKIYFTRKVKISIVDTDSNKIANQTLSVSYSNSSYPYLQKDFVTSQNGTINTVVPISKRVFVKVYRNTSCGGTPVGSLSYEADEFPIDETFIITEDSGLILENLKAGFYNCDTEKVEDSYVILQVGVDTFYNMAGNGDYNIRIARCPEIDHFAVDVIDFGNDSQKTGKVTYNFIQPTTFLGDLMPCDSVKEFIQYSIDDTERVWITSQIYAGFNPMNPGYNAPSLTIFDLDPDPKFNLFGLLNPNPYIGTYDNYIIGDTTDRGFNIGQNIDVSDINNNISYELIGIGSFGEYIDLHFSGGYEDHLGTSHHIVGVIHVFRD